MGHQTTVGHCPFRGHWRRIWSCKHVKLNWIGITSFRRNKRELSENVVSRISLFIYCFVPKIIMGDPCLQTTRTRFYIIVSRPFRDGRLQMVDLVLSEWQMSDSVLLQIASLSLSNRIQERTRRCVRRCVRYPSIDNLLPYRIAIIIM